MSCNNENKKIYSEGATQVSSDKYYDILEEMHTARFLHQAMLEDILAVRKEEKVEKENG